MSKQAANTMLISASYQEKDEKQLRDKLVTKLKQKAEDREVGLLIIIHWNFLITNQGVLQIDKFFSYPGR